MVAAHPAAGGQRDLHQLAGREHALDILRPDQHLSAARAATRVPPHTGALHPQFRHPISTFRGENGIPGRNERTLTTGNSILADAGARLANPGFVRPSILQQAFHRKILTDWTINCSHQILLIAPRPPTPPACRVVVRVGASACPSSLNDREFHFGGCGGAAGTSGSRTTSGS